MNSVTESSIKSTFRSTQSSHKYTEQDLIPLRNPQSLVPNIWFPLIFVL